MVSAAPASAEASLRNVVLSFGYCLRGERCDNSSLRAEWSRTRSKMGSQDSERDYIDGMLARWTEVRPELDTSAFAIGGRMRLMVLFIDAVGANIAACHGIKRGEADILIALLRRGAPYYATPTELSQTVWITAASITRRIDRLVALHLVERERDSLDDRREVLVRLTPRGQELTEQILSEEMARQKQVLQGLSAHERQDLVRLLRKLLLTIGVSEGAPPSRLFGAARAASGVQASSNGAGGETNGSAAGPLPLSVRRSRE